jgi:hypothetical protein
VRGKYGIFALLTVGGAYTPVDRHQEAAVGETQGPAVAAPSSAVLAAPGVGVVAMATVVAPSDVSRMVAGVLPGVAVMVETDPQGAEQAVNLFMTGGIRGI